MPTWRAGTKFIAPPRRVLAPTDRRVLKRVAISRHQDEGFAAPITRFTATAYLNDPDVIRVGTNNEVQFIDRTALPGVTYYYTISHVGTENIESVPTAELSASIPANPGPDTTAPLLQIVSPVMQDWSAYPRIVLNYADGGSGIDLQSLRVSYNRPFGGGDPGSDPEDQSYRRDETAFIAAMSPPLSLPNNTLVTLTASIGDKAGNVSIQQVQFFVSVAAPVLPVARVTLNPVNEATPLTVELDGSASTDADGKIVRWEWYFDDGTTALGRSVTKTYRQGGVYEATLLVRDTHGGTSIARQTISLKEFRLADWRRDANGFSFSFPTATNRSYIVERTDSLSPTNWTELTTLLGNGALQSVTHTNAGGTQQFYRVKIN